MDWLRDACIAVTRNDRYPTLVAVVSSMSQRRFFERVQTCHSTVGSSTTRLGGVLLAADGVCDQQRLLEIGDQKGV